jgi:hypothetical protein
MHCWLEEHIFRSWRLNVYLLHSKPLTKSQGTLSSRLSFCLPAILLFCPGAPKPWLLLSYQRTMLTVKALMFHLQCIFVFKTLCNKNVEAAESGHIFQFMIIFQRSVTHLRDSLAAHKAVTTKARACCVRVRNFGILACIILAVASIYNML